MTNKHNKSPLTLADIAEPRPSSKGGGNIAFRLRRACRRLMLAIFPRKMTRQFVRGGLHYKLDGMGMNSRLFGDGHWEPKQIEYFFNTARERGANVFLDAGANIGYYSLLAARLGIFDEIHALEPEPETYQKLLWHISANKFDSKITLQAIPSEQCTYLTGKSSRTMPPQAALILLPLNHWTLCLTFAEKISL